MNLYECTIRRTYTEEQVAKWGSQDYDTLGLRWDESEEGVRAAFAEGQASMSDYWRARYTDSLEAVRLVPEDELVARRAEAMDPRNRAMPCCPLAVKRSCVCAVSYTCPEHGVACHGTHD